MAGEHVMVGGSVSLTVTVKVQPLVPQALVAMQVTVVVPTENALPDAGEQLTPTGAVPLVVGVKVTVAEHRLRSLVVVMSPGHVITGGVHVGMSSPTANSLMVVMLVA